MEILQLLMFVEISQALNIILENWMWLLLGITIGMAFGAIPGLGGSVTLALILPFTFPLDIEPALILMASILAATTFAGSISAILINTPGTASNAATLLDGYPLSEQGKGAMAIGASAFASAAGAVVGIVIFIVSIPLVVQFALLFGPPQIFWVIILALTIIPLVAGRNRLAGLAMAGFGLFLAMVGRSAATAIGETRFTFGQIHLVDGVDFIVVIIGLFTFAEMFKLAAADRTIERRDVIQLDEMATKFDGIRAVVQHKFLWFRCTVIGILLGIIPGVGGSVATFVAYGHAVQSSSQPDRFGSGMIEGVIASEAANDSKDGGQLFPTLGLGIPGSGSMAVLLVGFLVHGLVPGPRLLIDELTLMLVIAFSLLIGNILTSAVGLIFTAQFTKITRTPISILFPMIIVVAATAVFLVRNSIFDVFMALVFGVVGIILMFYGVSRVAIVIALILGGIMEDNFFVAAQVHRWDLQTAFFSGWINWIIIIVLIFAILHPIYGFVKKNRSQGTL